MSLDHKNESRSQTSAARNLKLVMFNGLSVGLISLDRVETVSAPFIDLVSPHGAERRHHSPVLVITLKSGHNDAFAPARGLVYRVHGRRWNNSGRPMDIGPFTKVIENSDF